MAKTQLVANWRAVLKNAWSVRLMLLAALASGIEVALPLLQGVLPVPPGLFAILCLVATVGAFIARFVAQKTLAEPPAEPDFETGD
jgi:hypothetical protein